MNNFDNFNREIMLIGQDNFNKLKNSHIIVFGLGGVGGYAVEMIARLGVGKIDIVDNDTVSNTNLNRQIIALNSTIGKYKTDLFEERIKEINKDCIVKKYTMFYDENTKDKIDFSKYDYVIDAIDSVKSKLNLIIYCINNNINIISSMGMGNRIDPSLVKITDISKTEYDPLSKIIRKKLRENKINHLKVVYSSERPINIIYDINAEKKGSNYAPGSISLVPSTAGIMLASEVFRDLIK
ncbi:MAG: tRNA threonylcarbamoyladenosine dehydratase [Acholeplasmatales bacterium]|nr:tRNA threonylcarbamoyladenosine dehydratase [Acholeplasmatales bacterium]